MASPWAKIPSVEVVKLDEIMSEEVARDLQDKEYGISSKLWVPEGTQQQSTIPAEDSVIFEDPTEEQIRSDVEIAMLLQEQYNKEYDEMLKRTEDKMNGTSKIGVSFCNYKQCKDATDSDDSEEEIENPEDRKFWDRFDKVNQDYAAVSACGYKKEMNGQVVTKHDLNINDRRNACKMMSFPPEFETGDGAGFDLKLSNKVFNSLRRHSKNEQARKHKLHDKKEDQATAEFGVDEFTRLLLYKMINRQILDQVNGVISIGKEAVVLHADCNTDCTEFSLPAECVLKVFKTTLSEFKQRDQYIRDDFRFKNRIGKQNTRKIIQLWAEKEFANLSRLKKANIKAPEALYLRKHVLLMSFIGKDSKPAPKLKDAILGEANLIIAYDQVIEAMKNLYSKANLIHADLSEYNILWHDDSCYIIDVSQAVEPSHENAFHFLLRDCTNVSNFFRKKGTVGVQTAEEIFNSIVGCDFNDKMALLEVMEKFKMKPHLVDRPGIDYDCRFESVWKKAVEETAPTVSTIVDV